MRHTDAGLSPGAAREYFFLLPTSTVSADSLTVFVQPPCAIACISICAHAKLLNTGSQTIVWTKEIAAHTDTSDRDG